MKVRAETSVLVLLLTVVGLGLVTGRRPRRRNCPRRTNVCRYERPTSPATVRHCCGYAVYRCLPGYTFGPGKPRRIRIDCGPDRRWTAKQPVCYSTTTCEGIGGRCVPECPVCSGEVIFDLCQDNKKCCIAKTTGKCAAGYTKLGFSCYKYFGDSKNYDDAFATCKGEGALLLTIGSQEEQDAVANWLSTQADGRVWQGGTDREVEDDFRWMSGEPFCYKNWGTNEPNDLGGEDCIELRPDWTYEWNDIPCSRLKPFVCEKYLR